MRLINDLEAAQDPTDDLLTAVIDEVKSAYTSDVDIAARLAKIYALSGSSISFPQKLCIDVASTGGPSSLSTLIIPLFFSCVGLTVPKLGVPGRPAGGIDSLAQISSYRYSLTNNEVRQVMAECNYAHFLANDSFAPLDKRVFDLRKRNDAMSVPTLAAASLLSKKIAVGINIAGLDIRVAPHGNFGGTWEAARENALFFKRVAKRLGLNSVTVLSDARFPFQPLIGRKEALLALWNLFEGNACDWLTNHYNQCRAIAIASAPLEFKRKISSLRMDEIKRAFIKNLEAQGASYNDFSNTVSGVESLHVYGVTATHDGFITYSLERLREVLVKEQLGHQSITFVDPIGVRLLRHPGEWVEQDSPVLSFRCSSINSDLIQKALSDSFCLDAWIISTSDMEGVHYE